MPIEASETILADGKVAQNVVVVGADGASAEGATLAEQQAQTAHLAAIETAVENVGITRYPAISFWVSKIAFTGVAAAGITIQNTRVVDTATAATITSVWTNLATGLDLATPPVVDTEIEYINGTALTLAEIQSLSLAT